MSVTANLIKQLRNLTGSPIYNCKQALEESAGDLTKAQEWLRVKGISQAHKKLGKSVSAGLVGGLLTPNAGYLLEVLCETDFVARTDLFKKFTTDALMSWSKSQVPFSQISSLNLESFNHTLEEVKLESISKLGENVIVRRGEVMEQCSKSVVGLYLHNSFNSLLSESGVLLKLQAEKPLSAEEKEWISKLANSLCMQVVAAKPLFLLKNQIPQEYREKERMAVEEQMDAKTKAKPKNIYDDIVKGKLEKSLDQVTLYEQTFMISEEPGEQSVKQVLNDASKKIDSPLTISSYKFYQCESEVQQS